MGKITKEKFKVFEGVFDNKTLRVLEELKRKKYFDEFKNILKTGKEANVYLAKKSNEFRAIKIFRINNANFNKISSYIKRDYRFKSVRGNFRKIIWIWSQKEYRNLILAHKSSMNVPFAFKNLDNVIIMEFISGEMLKDSEILNPKKFLDLIFDQIEIMILSCGLVHGDLSEFNIMVENQKPFFIDWGQAMSFKSSSEFIGFLDLFERDIENICNFFIKRYNFELDINKIIFNFKKKVLNKYK